MGANPKRLAVIGATGGTGQELVRRALENDNVVTALVRDPSRFELQHSNLTVVRADVLVLGSLLASIGSEHDAVLSALGVGTARGPVTAFSEGTRNIFAAMEAARIKRFVGLSAAGIHGDAYDPFYLRYLAKPILQRVFRHSYEDMARMEAIVEHSPMDWTLVVPTRLTNGKPSPYRIAVDHNVPRALQVSRANVAQCMLAALSDPGSIRHSIYVAD